MTTSVSGVVSATVARQASAGVGQITRIHVRRQHCGQFLRRHGSRALLIARQIEAPKVRGENTEHAGDVFICGRGEDEESVSRQ